MIALRQCRPAALPSTCSLCVPELGNVLWSVACHPRQARAVASGLYLCKVSAASEVSTAAIGIQEKDAAGPVRRVFRLLDTKEVKELRAFAHQRKKDIVIQHVGKFGITPTVVKNLTDALEANELIKVRILSNCPQELEEMQAQLEHKTEAQVIEKIGNTVLLYRPSLNKLAAAEKRNQGPKSGKYRK